MTPIENLINRLHGVRWTGPGRGNARCPAHDDRNPSMAFRECDDGRILIHCFGGCAPAEIVAAVGLSLSDLFPPNPENDRYKSIFRPFPAVDILACLYSEALIVQMCGRKVLDGDSFSEQDQSRLALAVDRVGEAVNLSRRVARGRS